MSSHKPKRFVWSEEKEDLLIDLYAKNEHLYNTRHKAYFDGNRKYLTMLEFSAILNVPVDEVEKHLRSLRTQFGRQIKEMKHGNSEKEPSRRVLRVLSRLEFLAPYLRHRTPTAQCPSKRDDSDSSSREERWPSFKQEDDFDDFDDETDDTSVSNVKSRSGSNAVINNTESMNSIRHIPSDVIIKKEPDEADQMSYSSLDTIMDEDTMPSTSGVNNSLTSTTETKRLKNRKPRRRSTSFDSECSDTKRTHYSPSRRKSARLTSLKHSLQDVKDKKPKCVKSSGVDRISIGGSQPQTFATIPTVPFVSAYQPSPFPGIVEEGDEVVYWGKMIVQKLRRIEEADIRDHLMMYVDHLVTDAIRGEWPPHERLSNPKPSKSNSASDSNLIDPSETNDNLLDVANSRHQPIRHWQLELKHSYKRCKEKGQSLEAERNQESHKANVGISSKTTHQEPSNDSTRKHSSSKPNNTDRNSVLPDLDKTVPTAQEESQGNADILEDLQFYITQNTTKPGGMEVCVDSVESAVNAEKGGACRVELCANLMEGGTTPSIGMLKVMKKQVAIPVFVMIRPRGGDFLYSDSEYDVMKSDVQHLKEAGADGVVIGLLTSDGAVDMSRCRELIGIAKPLPVTFHRAIDMCRDISQAMEHVIKLGCSRILTSGGEASALEGAPAIASMITQAAGRITIVPGGGIHERNLARILDSTGAKEFHGSARSAISSGMSYQRSGICMGAALSPPEFSIKISNASKVEDFLTIAQTCWNR